MVLRDVHLSELVHKLKDECTLGQGLELELELLRVAVCGEKEGYRGKKNETDTRGD